MITVCSWKSPDWAADGSHVFHQVRLPLAYPERAGE